MDKVTEFVEITPSHENYLRAVVLFGRNVASYKFALAKSLIDLAGQGYEKVTLEELAVPFSRHLCAHLLDSPKQATSASSRFLNACRKFNEGAISQDELQLTTAKLGFNNVIDAFHVVGSRNISLRFFVDERNTFTGGIRLTNELHELATSRGDQALLEVESRWRLVETAWELGIANSLMEYDPTNGLLVPSSIRRKNLASAKDTLNGYQKGACFYCYRAIGTTTDQKDLAEIDHLFPHVLMRRGLTNDLDQIWNLVLACVDCNRGVAGKFDSTPSKTYVERLAKRNDYLIESNLPIKQTLILQTGKTPSERRAFLQSKLDLALTHHPGIWETASLENPNF
jgi:5-methylcytosine-specific restriction endonuclease McrA